MGLTLKVTALTPFVIRRSILRHRQPFYLCYMGWCLANKIHPFLRPVNYKLYFVVQITYYFYFCERDGSSPSNRRRKREVKSCCSSVDRCLKASLVVSI